MSWLIKPRIKHVLKHYSAISISPQFPPRPILRDFRFSSRYPTSAWVGWGVVSPQWEEKTRCDVGSNGTQVVEQITLCNAQPDKTKMPLIRAFQNACMEYNAAPEIRIVTVFGFGSR